LPRPAEQTTNSSAPWNSGPEEDRSVIVATLDRVQRLLHQEEPPKPRHRRDGTVYDGSENKSTLS
jgi:hypothetical protein